MRTKSPRTEPTIDRINTYMYEFYNKQMTNMKHSMPLNYTLIIIRYGTSEFPVPTVRSLHWAMRGHGGKKIRTTVCMVRWLFCVVCQLIVDRNEDRPCAAGDCCDVFGAWPSIYRSAHFDVNSTFSRHRRTVVSHTYNQFAEAKQTSLDFLHATFCSILLSGGVKIPLHSDDTHVIEDLG